MKYLDKVEVVKEVDFMGFPQKGRIGEVMGTDHQGLIWVQFDEKPGKMVPMKFERDALLLL